MTATDVRKKIKSSHSIGFGKRQFFQNDEDSVEKHPNYDAGTTSYMFFSTAIIVTAIKFLLIPAYYSTDLEVHRNWMAITYNKPLVEWYSENTSQWTLDYPPFFAYFEFVLAYFAKFFDEKMLQIRSDSYISSETLFYLRLTIIISDLVYYYGVYSWIDLIYKRKRNLFASVPSMRTKSNFFLSSTSFIQITLFLFNVGHLMVDHVHFQYNGFLNGLLLISMAYVCNQQIYWGAFWFTILLNFKHIYLYLAPAYFIHLFVDFCLVRTRNGHIRIRFGILSRLAFLVIGIFTASFLPFILNGQIWNVLNRMFPFQRGLSHSYWAPNVWAAYNGFDLFLARFFQITSRQSSFTSGLVQESKHLVLPSITPQFTLACVLIIFTGIITSYIWKRFKNNPNSRPTKMCEIRFLHLVLLSSLTFYEFGYHVHEKSILLIIPTLIPLIFVQIEYARLFLLLSTAGYYSLFPLLYKEAESILKLLLMTIHLVFSFGTLKSRYRIMKRWKQQDDNNDNGHISLFQKSAKIYSIRLPLLNWLESFYIYGFIFIHFVYSLGPYIFTAMFERFQFLPLMLVSLYCSFGIFYCYVYMMKMFADQF